MPQVAKYYPGAGFDWRRKVTTHCKHGHAFTPENTLWREEGWRNCRACMTAAAARYQRRKAAMNDNPKGGAGQSNKRRVDFQ